MSIQDRAAAEHAKRKAALAKKKQDKLDAFKDVMKTKFGEDITPTDYKITLGNLTFHLATFEDDDYYLVNDDQDIIFHGGSRPIDQQLCIAVATTDGWQVPEDLGQLGELMETETFDFEIDDLSGHDAHPYNSVAKRRLGSLRV